MTLSHLCPGGEDRKFWEDCFLHGLSRYENEGVDEAAKFADSCLDQWCERFIEGYENK